MSFEPAVQTVLDRAAGLLAAVGRLDRPATRDPSTPMFCLLAADELCSAGAVPSVIAVTDVRAAIREALHLLGTLPDEVFDLPLVADAVDDAQDAFGTATD